MNDAAQVLIASNVLGEQRTAIESWFQNHFPALVGVVDMSAMPSGDAPLPSLSFCVSSKGLSQIACRCRNQKIALVSSTRLAHKVRSACTMEAAMELLRSAPLSCSLPPLSGYKLCVTGFSSASPEHLEHQADMHRGLITSQLEKLGALVQARLDVTVDVLLVPWTDLGEPNSERWTPKVQFASKSGVPVICGAVFVEIAQAGLATLDSIVAQYALPRKQPVDAHTFDRLPLCGENLRMIAPNAPSATIETELVSCMNKPAACEMVVEVAPRHVHVQSLAHQGENTLSVCTPMFVVTFGMSAEETIAARRLVAFLQPFGVMLQPVMTSLTTHVVVGKAVEAMASIGGNRDALEHFLTRLQRIPISRVKTMRWLAALCGFGESRADDDLPVEDEDADSVVDDRSFALCLRDHYEGHSLYAGGSSSKETQLLLNGFLAPAATGPPRPSGSSSMIKKIDVEKTDPKPSGRPPPAVPPPQQIPDEKCSKPDTLQPFSLLLELYDLCCGMFPAEVEAVIPRNSLIAEHFEGPMASAGMASLMKLLQDNRSADVFEGMTFLCLDEDPPAKNRSHEGGQQKTTKGEKTAVTNRSSACWLYSLHRKAAVRLLIKGCGGTFLRKTNDEIRSMIESDELLRADKSRGFNCMALIPHSFECAHLSSPINDSGRGDTTITGRPNAGHLSLRRQKQKVSEKSTSSSMDSLPIPVVTTSWLQAAILQKTRDRRIQSFPQKMRRALLRSAASSASPHQPQSELRSLRFLRHIPLASHPYAHLISAASLSSLERVLPLPPSPFLTSLRYVKHRVAAEVEDVAPPSIGHGVVAMFVCRQNGVVASDTAAISQTFRALGGQLEPISLGSRDTMEVEALPLHRVTHVITDCAFPRVPTGEHTEIEGQGNALVTGGEAISSEVHPRSSNSAFFLAHAAGVEDDEREVNWELLRCAVLVAQHREDVVVVDISWLRQSATVGYFVDEAEFLVGLQSSGSVKSAPHLPTQETRTLEMPSELVAQGDGDARFDVLADVMTSAVSRLERTVGEGNSSVLTSTPKPLTRKRSRTETDDSTAAEVVTRQQLSCTAAVKVERLNTSDCAPTAPRHAHEHDDAREESPTAAHCPAGAVASTALPPQPMPSSIVAHPARIYVLSNVPRLNELREAVMSRLAQPVTYLPGSEVENGKAWSHLEWSSTSSNADIVVSHEVTQRESVLFAMAAGLWLVTDAFVWDSFRERRLCPIEPYEWSVNKLSEVERKKPPSVSLAESVSHWRRLRQERHCGPFGAPCLHRVIVVRSEVGETLELILRVGGGIVQLVNSGDDETVFHNGLEEALVQALNATSLSSLLAPTCNNRQRTLVILVNKHAWRRNSTLISACVSRCLSSLRSLMRNHGDVAPHESLLKGGMSECCCSYPGHASSQQLCGAASVVARSPLAVEVHSHEWVSYVLQRRVTTLQMPLFAEVL